LQEFADYHGNIEEDYFLYSLLNFCLFFLLFKEHTESWYMSYAPLDLLQYISIYYSKIKKEHLL